MRLPRDLRDSWSNALRFCTDDSVAVQRVPSYTFSLISLFVYCIFVVGLAWLSCSSSCFKTCCNCTIDNFNIVMLHSDIFYGRYLFAHLPKYMIIGYIYVRAQNSMDTEVRCMTYRISLFSVRR